MVCARSTARRTTGRSRKQARTPAMWAGRRFSVLRRRPDVDGCSSPTVELHSLHGERKTDDLKSPAVPIAAGAAGACQRTRREAERHRRTHDQHDKPNERQKASRRDGQRRRSGQERHGNRQRDEKPCFIQNQSFVPKACNLGQGPRIIQNA